MPSAKEQTAQALRQYAAPTAVVALVASAIAVLMWLTGGFARANPNHGLVTDVTIFVGLIGFAIFTACLVIIDFAHHLLPHIIMIPATIWVLLVMLLAWVTGGDGDAVLWGLMAGLAVGLVLFGLALLPHAGLGGGDVKLAALLTAVVGWLNPPALFGALMVAVFGSGVFALTLMMSNRATAASAVPLGPFLVAGAWIGLALGLL